jgi:stage II sporulation protein D
MSVGEMSAKLKSPGRRIETVDEIKAGKRDASGRLEAVDIRSGDHWAKMGVEDLRAIVGTGVIKSSNFRVRKYPDHFLFAGFGWGHGVGMCQWGAFTLSLGWWRAEKILKYYYPGTRVGKLGEILKEGK